MTMQHPQWCSLYFSRNKIKQSTFTPRISVFFRIPTLCLQLNTDIVLISSHNECCKVKNGATSLPVPEVSFPVVDI